MRVTNVPIGPIRWGEKPSARSVKETPQSVVSAFRRTLQRPAKAGHYVLLMADERVREKLPDQTIELLGLLELRHVAAIVDDDFAGAGDGLLQTIGSGGVGQLVVFSPENQRRRFHRSHSQLGQRASLAHFLHLRDRERGPDRKS